MILIHITLFQMPYYSYYHLQPKAPQTTTCTWEYIAVRNSQDLDCFECLESWIDPNQRHLEITYRVLLRSHPNYVSWKECTSDVHYISGGRVPWMALFPPWLALSRHHPPFIVGVEYINWRTRQLLEIHTPNFIRNNIARRWQKWKFLSETHGGIPRHVSPSNLAG